MSVAGTSAANVLRLGKSWWKVPFLVARSLMEDVVPLRVCTITRMRRPSWTASATASSALPSRRRSPSWAKESVAQSAVSTNYETKDTSFEHSVISSGKADRQHNRLSIAQLGPAGSSVGRHRRVLLLGREFGLLTILPANHNIRWVPEMRPQMSEVRHPEPALLPLCGLQSRIRSSAGASSKSGLTGSRRRATSPTLGFQREI